MLAAIGAVTVAMALWVIPARGAAQDECTALYANPKLKPLAGKVVTNPPGTFAQLTDASKPTDGEQLALIEFDKARIQCSNLIVREMADSPEAVDLFSAAVRQEQEARAELYLGKISFGEYNTAVQRMQRAAEEKATALDRQEAGAQRGQDQGGVIARGAAAGARQALPVYNPFPKPLICTSTRRGTLVDTYCR